MSKVVAGSGRHGHQGHHFVQLKHAEIAQW